MYRAIIVYHNIRDLDQTWVSRPFDTKEDAEKELQASLGELKDFRGGFNLKIKHTGVYKKESEPE